MSEKEEPSIKWADKAALTFLKANKPVAKILGVPPAFLAMRWPALENPANKDIVNNNLRILAPFTDKIREMGLKGFNDLNQEEKLAIVAELIGDGEHMEQSNDHGKHMAQFRKDSFKPSRSRLTGTGFGNKSKLTKTDLGYER